MKKIAVVTFLAGFLFLSCSKRIFEAGEVHKMHDEYFILRKNGHYTFKISPMGLMRLPGNYRGRSVLSNDTVYFVKKESRKTFSLDGYGIIDSVKGRFTWQLHDSTESGAMEII